MIESILKEGLFNKDIDTQAAGTGTTNGDALDMAGYDGVLFILALGDQADTSDITLKAQQDTAAAMSSAADITGASINVVAGASDTDDHLMILEVRKPLKRYVRAAVVVADANAVIESCVSIRYRSSSLPVTQGDDVAGSKFAVGA